MKDELIIEDKSYFKKLKDKKLFPLHIHWDGSIPAESIFELAGSKGIILEYPEKNIHGSPIAYKDKKEKIINSPSDLHKVMTDLRKYDLIDVFSYTTRFMQSKEDIIAMAVAHCTYLKNQNVAYAETRFAPQYHTFEGLSIEEVIEYAVEGFHMGSEKTDVDVRLILTIGREADPDYGKMIAEKVISAHNKYPDQVIALDLACEERGNPPEKHYPAFEITFDTSLKRTIHAGEMCSPEENLKNIKTAVNLLRADGIGHGIHLYKDQKLVEEVVEKGIRIESNPISNNIFFNYQIDDLHLNELVEKGVLITINPDDPAMFKDGELIHNLYLLGKKYGDSFVDKVIANSIRASWGIDEKKKIQYLDELKQ